ncbi:MAG TPA: rRNA maturation RNase YbeY [Candidatus Paceibacterota bacterium]|nr:rRNA maturation RNase YbeY [Candidatus Paceibacterota bacterium]
MLFEATNLSVAYTGSLPHIPFTALKEKVLGKRYVLSIAFVTPARARRLNYTYRRKRYTPNTLSFALDTLHGEIVLCRKVLRSQYKKFDMTYETYLTYILIHSMLHLKGMTHGSTMERKEKELLTLFTPLRRSNETNNNRRH